MQQEGGAVSTVRFSLAVLLLATFGAMPFSRTSEDSMIGINFVGKGTASGTVYTRPLATTESAGAPGSNQANWNNAEGSSNSTGQSLQDENGQETDTTLKWTYSGKGWNANISDADGNGCLMKGYIYQFSGPPSVTVSGLGSPFTTSGYDVIVYFDGPNGGGSDVDWVTAYAINDGVTTATIYGKDAKTAGWSGTFIQAFGTSTTDATPGNYVRFTGLTGNTFTLTATPVTGSGPINGLQIVSVPEPLSMALLAVGLAIPLGLARKSRKSAV